MESSLSSIQALVTKIKEDMYPNTTNLYSFISPSAYDTAWLSMVPNTLEPGHPMFKGCLEWILNNQNEEGYWGESNGDGLPTVDALPATLACLVALKTWHVGASHMGKGLDFIHANMEMFLKQNHQCHPRWFSIVFPATVQLAQAAGLELSFPDELKSLISKISLKRQQILKKEELVDKYQNPPLLSYLESFPSTYEIDYQTIVKHLSEDGSLFQSPSATAHAFMTTGNQKCQDYLKSLVQICPNGVPPMYPMDEGLIKLNMVDQVQKLGLSEYFTEEIEDILTEVHRSYMNKELVPGKISFAPVKLYKDSLAFRLLRLHGYNIHPRSFCWFLYQNEILGHLEQKCELYTSLLYSVYRATDLIFSGEVELDEARSFSRTLLEKNVTTTNTIDNLFVSPNLFKVIEEELSIPWVARLDHLDHRMWIEQNKQSPLWVGKASFYRLSCVHNEKLMQLAVRNFELRQLTYQNELEELRRWSKEWGLSEMGFGREKTTYCYYAVTASTSLPLNSIVRMLAAKSGILITVADDFFDMEASLEELEVLIGAIQRWNGEGLSGPSKIIFDVLDDLVNDIAATYLHQQKSNITENLRDIWRETFDSWLTETTWGKTGYIPTVDEYLETGMTSIATHTIVLPSSCFLNPRLQKEKIKPQQYETITKALMATTRLLNDIQSYQKEQDEGKMNLVLLHFKENPEASIEDSIAYVKKILDEKRKELLEHVLRNGYSDLPKECKHLHLSCFKAFQMLFNSSNRYDSDTDLLLDIKKAIYIPPEYQLPNVKKSISPFRSLPKEGCWTVNARLVQSHHRRHMNGHTSFIGQWFPKDNILIDVNRKMFNPPVFNLCFI